MWTGRGETAPMSENGTPRRRLLPVAAAVLVGLGVIGVIVGVFLATRDNSADQHTSGGLTVGELQSAAAQQAALPHCVDVFHAGQKLDYAGYSAGCLDPQGGVQLGGWGRCTDGRILLSFEGTAGIPDGYGFVGDIWHPLTKHPIGADPGFAQAYSACG